MALVLEATGGVGPLDAYDQHVTFSRYIYIYIYIYIHIKVKVNQSHYRPGEAQRVPGS